MVAVAAALLAGACVVPPSTAPMPVQGQGHQFAARVACTTQDAPVVVEVTYGAWEPGRSKVSMVGRVDGATVSYADRTLTKEADGTWRWTSPSVPAGVCWSFDFAAVCVYPQTCPIWPGQVPFTYRIGHPA
jgi:1,4-alpha-glucan branching enzyme